MQFYGHTGKQECGHTIEECVQLHERAWRPAIPCRGLLTCHTVAPGKVATKQAPLNWRLVLRSFIMHVLLGSCTTQANPP